MKKSVLICDQHEDRLAVERVKLSTLTSGDSSKDCCGECYASLVEALPEWLVGPKGFIPQTTTTAKKPGRVNEQVMEVMETRAPSRNWRPDDIRARLPHLDRKAINTALINLAKKGSVTRVARGLYQLSQPSPFAQAAS